LASNLFEDCTCRVTLAISDRQRDALMSIPAMWTCATLIDGNGQFAPGLLPLYEKKNVSLALAFLLRRKNSNMSNDISVYKRV